MTTIVKNEEYNFYIFKIGKKFVRVWSESSAYNSKLTYYSLEDEFKFASHFKTVDEFFKIDFSNLGVPPLKEYAKAILCTTTVHQVTNYDVQNKEL